jgi:fatty-acid desaturase
MFNEATVPTAEGETTGLSVSSQYTSSGASNPLKLTRGRLVISSLIGIPLVHLLALAAPFTFTWAGFVAFLIMLCITSMLGVTLCYHRLLTHRSFKTSKTLKYIFTFIACLALQGGPIRWVATHRLHHKSTDKTNDPHSPLHGFIWAHLLWVFHRHPKLETSKDLNHYAPDLHSDPVFRFFDKYIFVIYIGCAALFFVAGLLIKDWQLGLSLVIWGFALRTVYTWHTTWLVNSAAHRWGYRSHLTSENSRNNWWVALLTFGEGWHNNHHAYPTSAKMGLSWFEIDMTYWFIKLLEWVGLAHKVIRPTKELQAA